MHHYSYDSKKTTSRRGKIEQLLKSAGLPVLIILLAAFSAQWILRAVWVFPLRVHSDSMQVTKDQKVSGIKASSRIFLVYPHLTQFKRGDVVYMELSSNHRLLCRIAGLEGEKIAIENRLLFINGKPVSPHGNSTDKIYLPGELSVRDQMSEITLFPGEFFCLNDNLDNTNDSRTYGALSYSMIRGKKIFGSVLGF